MPIKFRCRHCRQFLGISRTQAGEITNCPQCGKSIRVPALDGSVEPIPAPKLNLEDSQLADALSELARLESGSTSEQSIDEPVTLPDGHANAPGLSSTLEHSEPPALVVLAEPVTATASNPSAVSPVQKTVVDESTQQALSTLAEAGSEPTLSARTERYDRWKIIFLVAGIMTLLGIGLSLRGGGKQGSNEISAQANAPAADDPVSVGDPSTQVPDAMSSPAMTGRITYLSETGDSRPDSGAVALLLPIPRVGIVKLDESGFLSGADDIDRKSATAALHVLGGDVSTADVDGRFQLHVTTAGDYRFLVISHHQRRNASQSVEPRVLETLSNYFFRPSSLLGQLSFHFDDFHYRGQGTSPRDVTFASE